MGAMNQQPGLASTTALFEQARDLQAIGNASIAAEHYERVLELDPWHVGALVHAAALALAEGQQDSASQRYRELFNLTDEDILEGLECEADLSGALLSLTALCERIDRLPLAQAVLERMIATRPRDIDLRLNLGRLLIGAEQPMAAIVAFRRVTEMAPELACAWAGLGAAHLNAGTMDKARQALERAITLDPEDHGARRDLIAVLSQLTLEDEALLHYQELAARVDDDVAVLGDTGVALLRNGDHRTALTVFERVLNADPENCLAGLGAGAALFALDQRDRAEACVDHALQHVPRDAAQILRFSRIFAKLLPRTVLSALLEAAIDLTWDDPRELRGIVGDTYRERHGVAAVKGLQRLRTLVSDDPSILPSLIDAKLSICDWGGGDKLNREILAVVEDRMAHDRPLDIDVWNLFAVGADYPTLARAARYKSRQIAAKHEPVRAACGFSFRRTRASRRLRLGYLCPYTIKTSHIDNLMTVVRNHDRERFEIFGYSIAGKTGDIYERAFKDCFDQFRHTPLDYLEESVRRIHDDELDILFDSTGHFSATAMPLAAVRPAPLIVHGTAGFNIIGGAEFYDYSLNDRMFLSDELTSLYVEQPFYLPHSAMPAELLPIDKAATSRADFGIPDDAFVFVDFNHPCKFDPKGFAAWMEILRRVPEGLLVLCNWVDGTSDNLRRIAREAGVDPDRVKFAGFESRGRHLRRLQLCDLALDTFYHCGGVTTVDCLMAGLPVLTAVPDRPLPLANRSLLAAVGCEDMVMPDIAAYVEKAVELARDPDLLASVRARFEDGRSRGPLFQAERWVRNLERACAIMHDRWLDGDDPAPFSVLDVEEWPA